jgi:CheY-like chemotaxis protein
VERLVASLRKRSGSVAAEGPAARDLVEEVQRDARTGLLSVETPQGEVHAPLRAGEIQGSLPANPSRVSFEEIDATREDLALHDPSRLSAGGPMPSFDDLPAALRTVLVVDDNADMRRLLVRLLQTQGFTVHEAEDGETALALALERRPRLILADVRMPGVSGFELCRRVRAHSLIRRTPFLFLSGWDDYDVRQEGLDVGADDFVSKQSSLREILIRIQLLLKRYAALASPGAAAFAGRLDLLGAPDVLQVCHLNRLTGLLRIEDGGRRLAFRFREGAVIDIDRDGARAALFAFLSWDRGQFAFEPGDPGDGVPLEDSFGNLLLEGCRVLDEQRRAAGEGDTP